MNENQGIQNSGVSLLAKQILIRVERGDQELQGSCRGIADKTPIQVSNASSESLDQFGRRGVLRVSTLQLIEVKEINRP